MQKAIGMLLYDSFCKKDKCCLVLNTKESKLFIKKKKLKYRFL